MKLKVKLLRSSAQLPSYQTEGSAAMDISAAISEPIRLKPGEHALIPTGLAFDIPHGYEAQVRARSGHAVKHGIGLVNGVGTVDSDYRGEVGVILINWGKADFVVEPGMRIAQMVIAEYEQVTIESVEQLSETIRGDGGFGSTNS